MDSLEATPAVAPTDKTPQDSRDGSGARLPRLAGLSPRGLVTLCGSLLIAAVIAGALASVQALRERESVRTERLILEVSRTLADKTVFAIQDIDLVLRMTAERHGEEGQGADDQEVHRRLRQRIRLLTQARVLFVTDGQGQILHSSRSSPPPRLNLADRDYFNRVRDSDNLDVFVSRPDQDRIDPWRTFHFSRRLETQDGRFDGVAVALVDVDYITAFYQGSGLPPEALIRLIRNDGTEISRYSASSTATPTRPISHAGGIERSVAEDGRPVLASVYPLSHYPLQLEISLPAHAALADWRQMAWTIAVMALMASLAIAYYIRKFTLHLGRYQAKSAALQQSEERFDLAVRASMAGVFDWALPSSRLHLSPRFCELLGLPVAERDMSTAEFYALLHPDDIEAVRAAIDAHLTNGRALDIDCRRRSAEGTHTWFNLRGLAVRNKQGRPLRLVGSVTDVQHRHELMEDARCLNEDLARRVETRTQELQAANRELEAFSYSVSHDLRAPLRAIDGFSSLVLIDCGGQLSDQCRDYLQRSRRASHRMSQIIDDLLLLSRVTRGELKRQDIDLTSLAFALVEELRHEAPERSVGVAIEENLRANADPGLLRILLKNLLNNAWKFTMGRDNAAIAVGMQLSANGTNAFFVRDHGAGFDMKYADKLFRPFQRLHTREEFPGTGIGLATALRIVERHGGLIWGTGEVGVGATFYFTLDAGPQSDSPGAQPVPPTVRASIRKVG
jgi:PAS domain S-box-containing protein